jgi:hypothetical protein
MATHRVGVKVAANVNVKRRAISGPPLGRMRCWLRISRRLLLHLRRLAGAGQRDRLWVPGRIVVDRQRSHVRQSVGRSEGHGDLAALARRENLVALGFNSERRRSALAGYRDADLGLLGTGVLDRDALRLADLILNRLGAEVEATRLDRQRAERRGSRCWRCSCSCRRGNRRRRGSGCRPGRGRSRR